jgi:hypothetical protein
MSQEEQFRILEDIYQSHKEDPHFLNGDFYLEQEMQVDKLFATLWKEGYLKKEDRDLMKKYPFIVSSDNTGSATTSHPTVLRFAYVPSLRIEYYPSKNSEDSLMHIFMGKGENLALDRIYIRDKCRDICSKKGNQKPKINFLTENLLRIKRVFVYLPCKILEDGAQIGN